MQVNTKNPLSPKIQNQELFHVNSLKDGCSVTSAPIISKNHLIVKNNASTSAVTISRLLKATQPRNIAMSLV